MNIQNLMREAQKMQADLTKKQAELENNVYEGKSSLVTIVLSGKKEIKKLTIDNKDSIDKDDLEVLEDMIMIAFNDASHKVDADKEKILGKYGQGLSGLM